MVVLPYNGCFWVTGLSLKPVIVAWLACSWDTCSTPPDHEPCTSKVVSEAGIPGCNLSCDGLSGHGESLGESLQVGSCLFVEASALNFRADLPGLCVMRVPQLH